MLKKVVSYCFIVVFIACGSNQAVVRTSKTTNYPSKPVVRTVRKPIPKTSSSGPIVKKNPQTSPPEKVPSVVKQNTNQVESNTADNPSNAIEILEATTRVKVTTAMVLEYIQKYQDIAKEDMVEYGIPASITLGQGILESGAGTGPLSVQANNHFGIKCHKEWTGPSVKYDDDSEQECFRKYNQPNESYRDHSLFLVTRDRYSSLFKLDKTDYKGWAKGLKDAGYATDSAYPAKLIALIERYQLQKFDTEVLGVNYIPSKSVPVEKTSEIASADVVSQWHQVAKGDTLYSISKRYNISIDDLKKKNNIADSGIAIGQKLIVK